MLIDANATESANGELFFVGNDKNSLSNSCNDFVKVKCELCHSSVVKSDMYQHTKMFHKMTITNYKKKFEIKVMKDVFHKCLMKSASGKVCGKVVLWDRSKMASHLMNSHQGYLFTKYRNKYLTEKNSESSPESEEDEYEIEEILDSKIENGIELFLVKWRCESGMRWETPQTWETEENLSGAQETLEQFRREKKYRLES